MKTDQVKLPSKKTEGKKDWKNRAEPQKPMGHHHVYQHTHNGNPRRKREKSEENILEK